MLKTLERPGPLFTHGGGLSHKSKGKTKRKDIGKEEGDVNDPERSRSFLHSQVSVDGRSHAKRQRAQEIFGGKQCEISFYYTCIVKPWRSIKVSEDLTTKHALINPNAATLSGHFPHSADAMLSPDIDSDAKRDHQRENLWYHVGQSGKRAWAESGY